VTKQPFRNIEPMLLREDATVLDAIRAIDKGGYGIAFVVDESGRLAGVVTDRDTRNATLGGAVSADPIAPHMTCVPVVAEEGDEDDAIRALMQSSTKLQIPVVNAEGRVCDLRVLADFMGQVPLAAPSVSGNEWAFVKDCLDTNQLSSVGPYVDLFESKVAEYVGVSLGVACMSGTGALHIALLLAGVQAGDEVILPTLTFIAPVNAATYCGAIPAFVDSEWNTLGMSPDALADFLESRVRHDGDRVVDRETGRRIGAVVVVHVFGHPVDMDRLSAVCADWDIPLLEDAAESLGATYKGRQTGGLGLLAGLSFNGNKIITTAGGGMVLTNDASLARRGRHLTTQAKADPLYYVHDEIGFNYRMSNIHAAIGVAQFERLDAHIARKRDIAARYAEALRDLSDITVFTEQSWARSNYWLNTIFVPDGVRDPLLRYLNQRNVMARPVWELNNRQVMHRDAPAGPVPNATEIQARALNLPSSVDITDDEIDFICASIRAYRRTMPR
jgi:perosamine synthetase